MLQNLKPRRIAFASIGIAILILVDSLSCRADEGEVAHFTEKTLQATLKGRSFTLRQQPNHSGTLYLQMGTNEYVCRIEHSALFPLSSELSGIKIISITLTGESEVLLRATPTSGRGSNQSVGADDIKIESTLFKISVKHETLGRGVILISKSDGTLPDNTNHVFSVLGYVLKGDPFPAPKLYVSNSSSKMAHYIPSGHASTDANSRFYQSREEATSNGCDICPLCFNSLIKLPMLGTEIAMGKEMEAAVRHNERIYEAPEMHKRVNQIGRNVLSGWPTKLKGYNYRFSVLDDGDLNASACPGGYIFINRGLIESLEGDDELEAVLAHEIAHVEQRHGLMEYVKAQRDTRNAIIFASLITVGLGAGAAAAGNQDAVTIASAGGQVSLLLAGLAVNLASIGYSKQHEQEADIYALIYLQNRGKSKSALVSVLKKLRTSQEIHAGITGAKLVSTSHPSIKERLHAAESLEVQSFNGEKSFDAFEKDGDLLYNLTLHAQARYQKRDGRRNILVLGELSTLATIGESEKFSQIRLVEGKFSRTFDTDGDVKIGPLETLAVSFSKMESDIDFIQGEFLPSLNGIPAARVVKRKKGDE